eukprot:1138875-Pelagomonas_calceolata.AAC.3
MIRQIRSGGMQLGGQRDEGQTINPVIFSSIFQRLPALNDFAGVSGMEIVEQVQSSPLVSTLPTAKPPRTPEGSVGVMPRLFTNSQKDHRLSSIVDLLLFVLHSC